MPTLQPQHTAAFGEILVANNERLRNDLRDHGSCDTSYSLSDLARFRVNVFRQYGRLAIVMRKLSTEMPSLDGLGLPPVFREMIKEKTGIIFCTGATGSGKTTTLAALLNEINQTARVHVVTLEDPIEFLHPQKSATFSQRELGRDYSSFAIGLRAALRQAPKVILVGEIRDRETMEIALTAAETGHVVYSTLHTISAGQSISRIIGMFEQGEQGQVRERLASTLRYIVSQRLAPKVGGGRQLLTEIMGSNLRTREIVQLGENENRSIHQAIEAGVTQGWHSFEQNIIAHFEAGRITRRNRHALLGQQVDDAPGDRSLEEAARDGRGDAAFLPPQRGASGARRPWRRRRAASAARAEDGARRRRGRRPIRRSAARMHCPLAPAWPMGQPAALCPLATGSAASRSASLSRSASASS